MFLFQAQFLLNSFNLPSNRFYDEAKEENATYLKGSCHGLPTSKQLSCPSSKYEHRHCCVTFEIQRKYKDLYGKKPIVSVTYENERILIRNSLPYLKRVLSLSRAASTGRFMAVLWSQKRQVFFPYKSLYFRCISNVTQQC